jgi:hypothetical protein
VLFALQRLVERAILVRRVPLNRDGFLIMRAGFGRVLLAGWWTPWLAHSGTVLVAGRTRRTLLGTRGILGTTGLRSLLA